MVANDLEVTFGQSINDALLKESDLGLKESNIGLGVSEDNKDKIDYSTISALRVSKNQVLANIKLNKMKKNISEYELSKLNSKERSGQILTKQEQDQKEVFIREIDEFDREVKKYSAEDSRLDYEITTYGGDLI